MPEHGGWDKVARHLHRLITVGEKIMISINYLKYELCWKRNALYVGDLNFSVLIFHQADLLDYGQAQVGTRRMGLGILSFSYRYWLVDDYSFESLSFGRRMRLVGFDCWTDTLDVDVISQLVANDPETNNPFPISPLLVRPIWLHLKPVQRWIVYSFMRPSDWNWDSNTLIELWWWMCLNWNQQLEWIRMH